MKATTNRGSNQSDEQIGQRIRAARLEAKLSQSDVGDKLGVSFQQIQKYERGVNRISARDIVRIAGILNKPLSYFIGELGVKQSASAQRRQLFLATKQGSQLIDMAMALPIEMQQAIITLARNLAHGL